MKKIKKFKKTTEEFDSEKAFSKSRKKRLKPEQGKKKKLLRHYFEEE
jgi:hypothetical protein